MELYDFKATKPGQRDKILVPHTIGRKTYNSYATAALAHSSMFKK
jgi:hypothetical protein